MRKIFTSALPSPWSVLAVLGMSCSLAMADTVYVKAGKDPNGFPFKNVTINKIAKDSAGLDVLFYTTDNGASKTRVLDDIVRIEADGETAFTSAESEFVKGDLKAAATDYRKALSASTKDWVKSRSNIRLVGISAQIGDFLGSVSGFAELARKDPTSAAQHKPSIDAATPEQLQSAIDTVNKALSGSSADAKGILLPFLVDLYNKKGDAANATRTLAELKSMRGAESASPTPNADPAAAALAANAAKAAEADVAITTANNALSGQQYAQATEAIRSHSPAFTDPDRQAKAMYILAEAADAQAKTPEAMQDAALAYMRVVAHFKSVPGAPVSEALLKTAGIEEKLQKPTEALALYRQIVLEYKDSKEAQDAQAAIARLQSK